MVGSAHPTNMIPTIIEYCVRNRFIVILLTAVVAMWGVYCVLRTPIDAIPVRSKIGVQVCPALVLFQTPPPGVPK